jgi:hypothetical protein
MRFFLSEIEFKRPFLHVSRSTVIAAGVVGSLVDGSFDHCAIWIDFENVDGCGGCEQGKGY